MDEAEIRAEGVESALIAIQRIVNLLAFNAAKGITPALQVGTLFMMIASIIDTWTNSPPLVILGHGRELPC